jgi:hypothetical protein
LKDVDPSSPEFVDLGDTTKKNKWGNNAYHLHLDSNPSSLIPADAHAACLQLVNQMLGVTVHKEDEQSLTGFMI